MNGDEIQDSTVMNGVSWFFQRRREGLQARGQNCQMRPPASEASRNFFDQALRLA